MTALGLMTRFGLTHQSGEGTPPTPVPLIQAFTDIALGSTSWNAGWEFQVGANGITVRGARVRNSGTSEVVRLYRVSDGAVLGNVTITPSYPSWAQALFSAPIALTPFTAYAVTTIDASAGARNVRWSTSANGFTFDPRITYTTARAGAGAALPAVDGTPNRIYGLVDLLVDP